MNVLYNKWWTVKYLVCTFLYEQINNYICLFKWMRRKKLLELTMNASDGNSLEIDNLIDYTDPFDHLVDEISKKIKKKNK